MWLGVVVITLILGLVMFIYMVHKAQSDQVNRKTIKAAEYPYEQPMNIFFISDIHNRALRPRTVNEVKDADLVIIGGDLVDKRTSISRLKENLKVLKEWGAPVYFIPGNNDHELIGDDLVKILEGNEIVTLSNTDDIVSLSNNRKVALSGIDPYFMKPRREMYHLKERYPFQILCVHDPYVFYNMNEEDREMYDLVLTGHTHGGQIRIFGLGPFTSGGWFKKDGKPLLVSEGYGTTLLPLRLGTKAECHIITVVSDN
ncbi:metallophosphoesterase [Halobacillus yeomjeoni]|uniref:Metallophosphoesterase family protein n=1 Tax=Halobacillus yeomjeoni TaxID=311194 RepID=A0A931HUY4_9BACI|nr:metallophosphoesterase [Halobacillus yeomjeoni]MBH0229616.1 metallophosphoesterase family protein [Halobacillus yeomjeoni]